MGLSFVAVTPMQGRGIKSLLLWEKGDHAVVDEEFV